VEITPEAKSFIFKKLSIGGNRMPLVMSNKIGDIKP
jgi:hypothetical protein